MKPFNENPNSAIEVKRLTKQYGNLLALDQVSFQVNKGEIFGYLGPNGAGKTTTLNILATLLKPTSGTAAIFGNDVVRKTHSVRKNISLVLQAHSLDPFLNVYNNLYFFALLQKIPKGEREQRIGEIMEKFDLTAKRKASMFQLSGGLLRRLQLARVFLSNASLWLLDEPTLGIDIEGKIKIWRLIKQEIEEKGTSVFLATNDIAEAEFLCDRISFISQGKLLAVGTPEALKKKTRKTVLRVELEKGKAEGLTINLPPTASLLKSDQDWIEIELSYIESDLTTIMEQITRQAVIKDLDIRKPTIQDVFLHLIQNNPSE